MRQLIVGLGLLAVVAVIYGCAWLIRRMKNNAWTRRSRRKHWWLGYRAQRTAALG